MFTGVYTPIVTPFDREEEIDLGKMKHNLELWAQSELEGLLVLGSNGEFPYLSTEEKIRLTDFVRKNWSSVIDPLVFGDRLYNSRAVIDACIPYEHLGDFPTVVQTSPEYAAVMTKKFGKLLKEVTGD